MSEMQNFSTAERQASLERSRKNTMDRRTPKKVVMHMDLDDVLVNELGQFGRFQLINLLLVSLPMIMSPFINEYIFSAAATPHRCRIPECNENSRSATFNPKWILNAVPETSSGFSSCQRFTPLGITNVIEDHCAEELFNRSTTTQCDSYVYATMKTVVYDFDLGCQEWRRALAGTLNSVGTLLVLPITGYISDRFGRRMALILNVFFLGFFGLVRAFSVNYPMYLALQLLQTTLGAGTFSTAFIFAAELVGPKYRITIGAICFSMHSLGQVILGGVAWLVQPWRYMTATLFIPCFLVVSYYWILSESVRWLLSKQKYEEALLVLEKVSRVNGKKISEQSIRALMTRPPSVSNKEGETRPSLITAIFHSPVLLRRVFTTPFWWISTIFIYYGLFINSTTLSDTMYLNYILTGLIELPGYATAVLVADKFGRKPILTSGYFLSASCNFAFAFIANDRGTLRLLVFLLGKYGIAVVFSSLYLYTSELYPTEYRHTLLAFSSMVGRIGSIIAPLTPALKEYWHSFPSVLFGCMGLLAGLLVLTQPETRDTKLPESLADAETLGRVSKATS